MEDVVELHETTRKGYVYLISLIAAGGAFLFGYTITIVEAAIIFLQRQFSLTPVEVGFAISSPLIGCIIGPLIAGALSDWMGRKNVLFLSGLLFGVGAIWTALARDMLQFNTFRIITGFGIGLASLIVPMYIAEISPAHIRGALVSLDQWAIVIGAACAMIVGYFLSFSESWRWMFGSTIFPTVAFMVGLIFIPQSPRWLAQQERDQEARDILAKINGQESAKQEVMAIKESLAEETGTFSELVQPGVRYALVVALGLGFFQAANGAGTITWYAPIIFQKAGFEKASEAIFQTLLINLWSVLLTVPILFVDRVGRRPLLIIGSAGIALSQTLLGFLIYYNVTGISVLVTFFLVLGFYSFSLAPLAWIIMSEIFPTRIRARAQSVATVWVWVSTFVAGLLFAPLMAYMEKKYGSSAGAFWIFGFLSILAIIFCWRAVPETRGKTLEEIARGWLQKEHA